ncbi:uncharacterized protein TRUGW13939_00511 [Talaromyces rugulosus]|uniref:Acyltransferase MbtK/IucB-like conserved domain-containing protein n=1 Tax=Talaromyces rugulosus TaxID=121627 RepID=A0A7H8QIH0_TALRU|nr:uncharacterized protein TRUGW13939_00511 [Talaromyces rugulosus]QKX53432.1 hypothetical protein TRUGW13939_00511 [Talaromyces rugulosus]
MPSPTCHLPNGNTFSVTPVFGGVNFKSNDLNLHHTAFPPGWTVVIHTEKPVVVVGDDAEGKQQDGQQATKMRMSSFKQPTRQNDCIFISSISNPSSMDYKPPISPSRQIAMMLWATLWWYFHEPEPDLYLATAESANTPISGRPKGEWRVNIKREGIFKGRNIMQKMERMGLIANVDSSVGTESIESRAPASWERMFTSRRSFWQLDPRIFIFTLTPAAASTANLGIAPSPLISPYGSRPASPSVDFFRPGDGGSLSTDHHQPSPIQVQNVTSGPYTSSSHLPTYYPPPPTQYIFTNGVRHPLRPRPPHQGETFYSRYIPSVGQYLSFRVPVLSPGKHLPLSSFSSLTVSRIHNPSPPGPSDLDFLHKWMNDPRVNNSWSEAGPRERQENLLIDGLSSRHSFPVIGCWDGKPFGYFEIYWVKEDRLGRNLGRVGNYDRGLHLLVGEQEFRGPHRVPIWLNALVHYCWLADARTDAVLLEPRVDNQRIITYLTNVGFYKEGEVAFPHKQSAVMRINRDSWECPAL